MAPQTFVQAAKTLGLPQSSESPKKSRLLSPCSSTFKQVISIKKFPLLSTFSILKPEENASLPAQVAGFQKSSISFQSIFSKTNSLMNLSLLTQIEIFHVEGKSQPTKRAFPNARFLGFFPSQTRNNLCITTRTS